MSRQNRNDDYSELEAELRRDRPAPRPTFLQSLSARIEDVVGRSETPRDRARPRFRFGLAVAFATVFLAVFASFGGLGYANSSVRDLGHRGPNFVSHLIHGNTYHTSSSSSKRGSDEGDDHQGNNGDDDNGDDDDSAEHQYPHFVAICLIKKHKEIEIVVPQKVANKLIAKGKAHVPPCVPSNDD